MNNEELMAIDKAIKDLEELKNTLHYYHRVAMREAIDLGIEALKVIQEQGEEKMHIEVELLKRLDDISYSSFVISEYERACNFIKKHLPQETGWVVYVRIVEDKEVLSREAK